MELKGRLATFPLSDVLQFIEEKGHTGYLGLNLEFAEASYPRRLLGSSLNERLVIEKGRLHGLASLKSPQTWSRLLARGGVIPRWKEKGLRERLEFVGNLLLQTLTGMLDLDAGAIRERMEFFLRERSAWLFFAQDGDFWFEFEQPPSMPPGWEAVPLGELIQQGPVYAQMLESLSTVCSDPTAVVRVVALGPDRPPPETLEEGEWETLARVNGHRAVEDLLRDSRLPVYETAGHIVRLREHGYIQFMTRSKASETGEAEKSREEKGSRIGRLRGMLQLGRGTEEIPENGVGKICVLVNRLIAHAGDCLPDLRAAWSETRRVYPLASVLSPTDKGFDLQEFGRTMSEWGGNNVDWKEVEAETGQALSALIRRFYLDLVHSEGKKRAGSIIRRAWQDFPTDDGLVPKLEELEAELSAA